MSYGSSLSFVVIGQYMSEIWALDLSHISEVKFAANQMQHKHRYILKHLDCFGCFSMTMQIGPSQLN
jgi:hypothetical protein